MNNKLKGEYKLVVTSPDGTTKETGWIPNLILDQGLDGLSSEDSSLSGIFAYMQVGTGTSTPTVSQTALEAPIATENTDYTQFAYENAGSAGGYAATQTVWVNFPQGAVVGNITEIGIGSSLPPGYTNVLFSRALIVDESSNPVSISVSAFDQLTTYYRLTVTPTITSTTGTVTIAGNLYNFETLPFAAQYTGQILAAAYNFGSYGVDDDFTFGAIDSTGPAGTQFAGSFKTFSVTPYVPGSYELIGTLAAGPSEWNSAGNGIGGLVVYSGLGRYQMKFTPPIPKVNTETFTLQVKSSWARG